jgi:hypothetical protein
MESLCRAGGHTSRFLSVTYKIKARIALLHSPVASKPGHSERAGPQTGVAPDAFLLVNKDNAVIQVFLDSASWTGRLAGWVPTMHTSQRDSPICHIGVCALPDSDYASPLDTRLSVMQAPASHLTGMALNAPVCVKIKSELFRFHTPHPFPGQLFASLFASATPF